MLQTGALPLKFETVDRTDVSATLGKDSLRQAVIAAIGGIVAVALVLLIVQFLGLVAIAGLAMRRPALRGHPPLRGDAHAAGFAGLILTIGVAADANIVIFERIKEEVRLGKSVRAAIATGYRKGFQDDRRRERRDDDHRVHHLRGGERRREGFALMLLIGTLLSMFTAVAPRARCSGCSRASGGSTTRRSWEPARRRSRAGSRSTSAAEAAPDLAVDRAALIIVRHHLDRGQGPQPRHRLRGR